MGTDVSRNNAEGGRVMPVWVWGIVACGCIVYVALALCTLASRADERTVEMMNKRKEEE